MKGWQILAHSVRLVFTNMDAAFKISLVPYALSAFALLYFGTAGMEVLEIGTPAAIMAADPEVWRGLFAYLIVSGVAALWIAVAWHRYVLLEEYPTSWIARFHGGAIFAYLVKGIIIGLVIVGVVMVVSLILGLLIGWMGALGAGVTGLGVMAAASYMFYRLCPILPSAAVGQPMRVAEAWEATKDASETIIVLVVLVLVASFIIQLPTTVGASGSIAGTAYTVIVNWLSMLIGASVLTTFYGHYIEGRSID